MIDELDELTVPGIPELEAPDLAVRDHDGDGGDGGERRDHGGDGERSLVLVHGLGGNLLHWSEFAALLTPHFRVVTYDLRGHGRSGDGPLSWDALVGDLERVVDHLGLERPAVVGHSLGGGVATLWAERHPECPGAVNIDGIRAVETAPENYVGLDEQTALTLRAELTALFEAQADAMGAPVTDEWLETMRQQYRALGGESKVGMVRRNLRERDGVRYLRPDAATGKAYRRAMMDQDFFEVFAEVRCPLMICAATQAIPGTEQYDELLAAQRRGVERDLAVVERANPNLRVERLDASHGAVHEQPETLATLITDFLRTA